MEERRLRRLPAGQKRQSEVDDQVGERGLDGSYRGSESVAALISAGL